MALFQAKTGRDRLRVILKKKKLSFRSIPTRLGIGNFKKIAKKCKILRNIIMALFQAKTGLDRLSVKQKKTLSFRFIPTRSRIGNCQKIAKKCKNLKNIIMASFQAKTVWDRLRMKQKKMLSFWSILTRPGIGNSRKITKKLKKHRYGFFSSQNVTGHVENEKKKNYRSDPFLPNPESGISKKLKNIVMACFQDNMDR